MPERKTPERKIGVWPLIIAVAVIVLLTVIYLFTNRLVNSETKANADFICSAYNKTVYLPADQQNIPLPLMQNGIARPSVVSEYPQEEFCVADRKEGFLFYGYNETGKQIDTSDYIIRGASFDTPGSFIRGGRLGGDRSEEFLTRGIQIGDSREDVLRILGEPEEEGIEIGFTTVCPFYYFNAENGGRYRLAICLEDDAVILIRLRHSYTDDFLPSTFIGS